MAIRRIGDWERVGLLVRNLSEEIVEARDTSLRRFGLYAEGRAKKHMTEQDLAWVPLKPKTLARKLRMGYSDNILIETSTYFQSITSFVESGTAYIGVRREAVSKNGQPLGSIAAVHEYGSLSGNMPARPLWQPTFDETLRWFNASLDNQPQRIFLKNIKSRYGV